MPAHNLPKGKLGEQIAADYLTQKGYQIIDRNFRARGGEIDLIALHKNTVVFVEVKTRWGTQFGTPEEAVGYYKLKALVRTAQYYVLTHPKLPEGQQIDVLAVHMNANNTASKIDHFENITL